MSHLNTVSNEQIKFFNEEMEAEIIREDKIEKAIRAIIQGDQEDILFYLNYQPKLDLKTNKIIGFEALARMKIDGLGNISPLEFISIAERKMLIYDLGIRIVSQACQFIRRLRESGYGDIKVAINISVIQLLRDELLDDIINSVNLSEDDIKSMEFEITESVIMDNFELINSKLNKIRKLGISISLDDFGTGFSAFSRISELNIDTIKIDKCFIDKIEDLNNEGIIIADIISMAHKLGISVVAEGVEEEGQMDYLRRYNCDIVQGYHISRPLSEEDAMNFLISKQDF